MSINFKVVNDRKDYKHCISIIIKEIKNMLNFKKNTLEENKFDFLLNQIGLTKQKVLGEKLWFLVDPLNHYRNQRRIFFKNINAQIKPTKSGLEIQISGIITEQPYQSTKLSKHKFSYSIIRAYSN